MSEQTSNRKQRSGVFKCFPCCGPNQKPDQSKKKQPVPEPTPDSKEDVEEIVEVKGAKPGPGAGDQEEEVEQDDALVVGQRSEDNVRNSSLAAHEQYLKEFHLTYDQSRTKSHGLVLNSSAAQQQLQGMLAAPKRKQTLINPTSEENVPKSDTVSTGRDRNQVPLAAQNGLIDRGAQDQEQSQPNRGAN